MTTPRQIKIERCTFSFDFGEHEFEHDGELALSDNPTPELDSAYYWHLLGIGWVEGVRRGASEVLFDATPEGLAEANRIQREYAEYDFRNPNVSNLTDLKTYIFDQAAEWGYMFDTFFYENLLAKLAQILTKEGWSIIAASFNEFEGHHNNTSIEVGVERRTFI